MKKNLLFMLLMSCLIWYDASAQNEKFKALFMYNFTKYIEWPASQRQGDFVIGVLGSSGLTKELETIAGRQKVGTQNIVVKTFASVDAIENCQILYLPSNKSSQIGQVVSKLAGKSVLIISDKDGLALQGAGINYISDGDKLKYEVNKGTIEKKGLTVSNSLLSLGVVVSN
jgi:hypothetical protein